MEVAQIVQADNSGHGMRPVVSEAHMAQSPVIRHLTVGVGMEKPGLCRRVRPEQLQYCLRILDAGASQGGALGVGVPSLRMADRRATSRQFEAYRQ